MMTRFRRIYSGFRLSAVFLPCAFLLQGCGQVVNFEGVYFPSWVICLLIGVFGSAGALYALQRSAYRDCLPNHGLCFVCFATIFGVLAWLIFFRS